MRAVHTQARTHGLNTSRGNKLRIIRKERARKEGETRLSL